MTIAPGVTTGQLMKFFLDNDVCFKADVILASVTYGGVFSGGCHVSLLESELIVLDTIMIIIIMQGVGKEQPSMSDWIKHMTVVNGDGELKVIPDDFGSIGVSAEEILSAASASLGMFGVIVGVTVAVTPIENVRVKNVFSHKLSVSCNYLHHYLSL